MVVPITIRGASAAARGRTSPPAETRVRVLRRLYQRRQAVENLIRSLEAYRDARARRCVAAT